MKNIGNLIAHNMFWNMNMTHLNTVRSNALISGCFMALMDRMNDILLRRP